MLGVIVISLLVTPVLLWAFRRFSDQEAIRLAKRMLLAHLYEFRLYADEPALIWRAQKQLLRWNFRYFWLMLRPAGVVAVPMVVLLVQMEAIYGHRALRAGEPAIVTVQMEDAVDMRTLSPSLDAPANVVVETPPVRLAAKHQICWRVRALRSALGSLRFTLPDVKFEKTIDTREGLRRLSMRRVASVFDKFWHPGEALLPRAGVQWIEVAYPPARLRLAGLSFHWLLWFLLISAGAMLLFKRKFHVAL